MLLIVLAVADTHSTQLVLLRLQGDVVADFAVCVLQPQAVIHKPFIAQHVLLCSNLWRMSGGDVVRHARVVAVLACPHAHLRGTLRRPPVIGTVLHGSGVDTTSDVGLRRVGKHLLIIRAVCHERATLVLLHHAARIGVGKQPRLGGFRHFVCPCRAVHVVLKDVHPPAELRTLTENVDGRQVVGIAGCFNLFVVGKVVPVAVDGVLPALHPRPEQIRYVCTHVVSPYLVDVEAYPVGS